MSENKRYVAIDYEEVYYITDTEGLKTLDDFIKEFSKPEYEFTQDEILSTAKESYWQMIYENSMSAKDNVDKLNELNCENKNLSKLNKILEGFLLDKGYDFNDIIKFIQERIDGKGDV